MIGARQDITERMKIEESLRESEERYKALFDRSLDCVYINDFEGHFIDANNATLNMLGYKREEIRSLSFVSLLSEDQLPIALKALQEIRETGFQKGLTEFRLRTKNGDDVYVETKGSAILSKGNYIAIQSIARNITERKRAEEEIRKLNAGLEQRVRERTAQLEEANKELEAFSYSISHDLRAPLRAIDGFSHILQEDYAQNLDTEGKRACSIIQENIGRMNLLIDDLLTLSRLGCTEMESTQINMDALVKSVYRELTKPEERERIDFRIESLCPAVGDFSLIRQVWINLLGNAIKFSSGKERAVIEVSSDDQGEEITYFVRDNGAGFDMQYADKLFGVFQRLHSEREFEGTGVGLAIVQRIIHRHGGRVWAEGKVNEGATVWFSLPVGS
jgi:PAS domain S-box-containing protein